jgi:hypothetical protein
VKVKVKDVETELRLITLSVPQYAAYTRREVSLLSFLTSALELVDYLCAASALTPS